jgi:predicted phosphoribosyltransferase
MEPLFSMPYLPNLCGSSEHRPIEAACPHPPVARGFRDRREAGRQLARVLAEYAGRPDVLVLAIPCGGVPVAYEVARDLGAPLDVFRDREPPEVRGKTVLLVDDGSATPACVRGAVAALRETQAGRIVVAVPAAAPETCAAFSGEADEVVCARTPEPFYAVGLRYLWYQDPAPTSDEEVRDLLARCTAGAPNAEPVR